MKLELNQLEIEAALVEYVGSQGISISDKTIDVHMVAGRGGNGFTAHITIERESENDVTNEDPLPDSSNQKEEKTDEPGDDTTLFP